MLVTAHPAHKEVSRHHVRSHLGVARTPVAQWVDTRDSLQLRTQVVGKVRLAQYAAGSTTGGTSRCTSPRAASTTSPIPYAAARRSQIDFDFIDHRLVVAPSDGAGRTASRCEPQARRRLLPPRAWARSHELGCPRDASGRMPIEIARTDPLRRRSSSTPPTTRRRCTDSGACWSQIDRVFEVFRSRFLGKAARCTSSGALSIWPSRASPAAPRPSIRAACRTAARMSCGRPIRTKSAARDSGRAQTAKVSSTPMPTRAARIPGRVGLTGTAVVRRRSG